MPLNAGDGGGLLTGRLTKTFVNTTTDESTSLSMYPGDGPEAEQWLREFIRIFAEHLRKKGWLEDALFYLWDEPGSDEQKFILPILKVGRIVKEACPDLTIMIVGSPDDERLLDVIDLFVPSTANWRPDNPKARERIARARQHGKRFWWYSCGNPYPTTGFVCIGAPPIILRTQFWMNWKYAVPGTLYWSATNFESELGDGKLHYPDLGPSVRLVMIRDGIEDYEYFHMLDEMTRDKPDHPARGLLEIPADLIQSIDRYAIEPQAYATHRDKLAEAIESFANRN